MVDEADRTEDRRDPVEVSTAASRAGAALDEWIDALRARLADRRVRWVLASLAVLAAVVAVGWAWPSGGSAAEPEVTVSISTTSTSAPGIVVHVAGAVRSPGLYRLSKGARVADLLEAAGGPAADLDLDRTNLAETLSDGARVWLPRRGEASPAVSGGVELPTGRVAPVDINTATAIRLDTVTGIGPTLAAAIVKERDAHGPFRTVDDLRRVKGIGASKLESLRPYVTAG